MNYIINGSPLTNDYNQFNLTVDIEMMQFNCYTFLEKSMCQHLIAGCLIVNKEVPGVELAVIIFKSFHFNTLHLHTLHTLHFIEKVCHEKA